MRPFIAAIAACLLFAKPAQAVEIVSVFVPLSDSRWSIELTVRNTDITVPTLGAFVVGFDELLYRNLAVTASPSGWDSIVLQPDLMLPSSGFFDALALSGDAALLPGDFLSGFVLQADFIGTDAPRALPFSVYDDSSFVLASGFTTLTAVPEPATGLLFALGAVALLIARQRHSSQGKPSGLMFGAHASRASSRGVKS